MTKPTHILPSMAWVLIGILSATITHASPDPSKVFIKRITYAGSGCKESTASALLADDAESFTLIFDNYVAEIGEGVDAGHNRVACKVTVDLRFPSGYAFAISEYTYRGYADLDPGVRAKETSKYYFQNNPGHSVSFHNNFDSSDNGDFIFTDSIGMSSFVWSRCGRVHPLVIDTDLKLDNALNPEGAGLIGIDSLDGSVKTVMRYKIYWNDSLCE